MKSSTHQAQAEQPGWIGGRYRVEGSLGRGGTAQVLRVHDSVRGGALALKLLLPNAHERLRALFELEYQTLASLRHPRAVRAYDFGHDERGAFYTMELLEGTDLSSCAPMPWREVCNHIADAAEALGLLHARKLIHRDVSPRNLWRTPDGRVKLIDFGALTPFGVCDHVIGTPPLVPPEALGRRPLDQRADLYALGAVAYFLLTGRHAFLARELSELPALWRKPARPPSALLAEAGRPELDAIPAALDELVLSLLQAGEQARLSSSAELIDRIDGLRGAGRVLSPQMAEARLGNVAFVGRDRPWRRLQRQLALATRGHGQACVIESEPGIGRTRLLDELVLSARVARAHVLQADASAERGPYGVASALGRALLDALPEQARARAGAHAQLLAHASAALAAQLGVVAEPTREAAGELRARVQEAFCEWLLAVSREHALVIAVDGLEHADDASVALLLALSRARRGPRLLIACALLAEPRSSSPARSAALRLLVQSARSLVLAPLTEAEHLLLLRSAFGEAEHLVRLAGRLHRATGGNPGHTLDLCRQLVQRGTISFASGSWMLPRELDERSLTGSRQEAVLARLTHMQGPARSLARLLSVRAGPLTPGLCRALAAVGGDELLPQLGELIGQQLLVPNGASLRFAHESLRRACLAELESAELKRARAVLALQLMEDPSALERLRAGVHLLASGRDEGAALVTRQALHLVVHEQDKLGAAAVEMEQALDLLRAAGRSAYEQMPVLAALVVAGYHADRRYLHEYGPRALELMQALLGLDRARQLRPKLGRRLSLYAGLGDAAWRFWRQRDNPCVPAFSTALSLLFACVAVLTGGSLTILDTEGTARYARVLEPFAVLGLDNVGGFMAEFVGALADTSRDETTQTYARWLRLLARLEAPKPIRGAPSSLVHGCHSGALFAVGAIEVYGDGSQALRRADALERTGSRLDQMCADQLRTVHYGNRGDLREYQRHRERIEQHAIAQGTMSQMETWIAGPASAIAFRLHDALGVRTECDQLERFAATGPALDRLVRQARASYLMARERYTDAVALLEDCLQEPPCSRIGWGCAHGQLAYCHNRLGQFEQAHRACSRALAHLDPADHDYPALNLSVSTELALAEAGLGRFEQADERWAGILERHRPQGNPLTIGPIYEVGLELALLAHDLPLARRRLTSLTEVYRATKIPTLTQHCARLAQRLAALESPLTARAAPLTAPPANDVQAELDSLKQQLTAESDPSRRALSALRILAQYCDAERGVLYLLDEGFSLQLAASLQADAPSPALERWVRARIDHELTDELTTQWESEPQPSEALSELARDGALRQRMVLLTAQAAAADGIVGLAVLSSTRAEPRGVPQHVLRVVAEQLCELQARPSQRPSARPA